MLLHRLASIVRWMVKRNKAEAELDDELRTFVEMAAADHIRDGATPAEARRRALLQLGGMEQAKERVRTGRYGAWLDEPRATSATACARSGAIPRSRPSPSPRSRSASASTPRCSAPSTRC